MNYSLYYGDTFITLTGDDLTSEQWQEFAAASSQNSRQSASYAVYRAIEAAKQAAFGLAKVKRLELTAYTSNPAIEDDGTIATAVEAIRVAVEARRVKIGGQPAAPQYPCAGQRNGCARKVSVRGEYCGSCAHDEE